MIFGRENYKCAHIEIQKKLLILRVFINCIIHGINTLNYMTCADLNSACNCVKRYISATENRTVIVKKKKFISNYDQKKLFVLLRDPKSRITDTSIASEA